MQKADFQLLAKGAADAMDRRQHQNRSKSAERSADRSYTSHDLAGLGDVHLQRQHALSQRLDLGGHGLGAPERADLVPGCNAVTGLQGRG